jgi:protein-ribulosamine 3-kinase
VTLPAQIRREVEQRFGELRTVAPVAGGCISNGVRAEIAAGPIFLKFGADTAPGLFRSEAHGLRQLAEFAGDELKVPEVLAVVDEPDTPSPWLALEWLETGKQSARQAEALGHALARLHAPVEGDWGDDRPGFIGSLPQDNAPAAGWASFWRDRRLVPQLQRCGYAGGTRDGWERLLDALPELLTAGEEEGSAPLHGDLWSGNVLPLADGRTALIDPSFYRGHREVDLAMADLFGGLTILSRGAYLEARPLAPGYEEVRRGVYQLYYLLVHVNLFGGGYVQQTEHVLRQVLAA